MLPIPVYLKTEEDAPRPDDSEFYWVTQDGVFLCRNHPFFKTDAPTKRPVKTLSSHEPNCDIRYPRISQSALEFIVGFFSKIYELHQSESVILLFWDLTRDRYKIWVPEQVATVKEFWDGDRIPLDVSYTLPMPMPANCLLVGDIHCHGNMDAYASFTDRLDEQYRDGVHGVIGRIHKDPPEFHLELAIDGYRFELEFDQLFECYGKRREYIPQRWIDQVQVEVEHVRRYFFLSKKKSSNDDDDDKESSCDSSDDSQHRKSEINP